MIRGVWTHTAIGLTLAISLLPVLVALVVDQGAGIVPLLASSALVIAAWQALFRIGLGVPFAPAGAITAIAVGVLAPQDAPLWQILLAVSFGTVIGELIFGGWGRSFLSAAIVSLAFLSLSVPAAQYTPPGVIVAYAMLPGAATLIATGILSLPVLIASIAGFALVGNGLTFDALPAAPLAFALIYLIADPVAAAATPLGRWIYGALAGALAALLMAGPAHAAQAVVFATLLAQIFAPLIDQGALALHRHRRKARHG